MLRVGEEAGETVSRDARRVNVRIDDVEAVGRRDVSSFHRRGLAREPCVSGPPYATVGQQLCPGCVGDGDVKFERFGDGIVGAGGPDAPDACAVCLEAISPDRGADAMGLPCRHLFHRLGTFRGSNRTTGGEGCDAFGEATRVRVRRFSTIARGAIRETSRRASVAMAAHVDRVSARASRPYAAEMPRWMVPEEGRR